MLYKNTGKEIVVRLDDGEEIIESLKVICKNEGVESALVTGIGAARKAEIGHWNSKAKKYNNRKFDGTLEIVSLSGNVATVNNEPVVHLHIALGTSDFFVRGGHLINAEVYPTCEILLLPINTKTTREKNEKIGLNLQKF